MLTEKERLEAVNQATQLAIALDDKEAMQVCLKEYLALLAPQAVVINRVNESCPVKRANRQAVKNATRGIGFKLTAEQILFLYNLFEEGCSAREIRNDFVTRFGRTITEQTVFNYKNKWKLNSEVKEGLPSVTSLDDRPDY